MKILYYITDHGLGHASRSVAVIRELKNHAEVIVRHNDPYSFVERSLPDVRVIHGQTDFLPVMDQNNRMLIDGQKTQASISTWIKDMPSIVEKELDIVKREKPDLIVSDISVMPLLLAKKTAIRSVAISNFTWNETLGLDKESAAFFNSAYSEADLVIKLPLGTDMPYPNRKDAGLVARKTTVERSKIRKQIGIDKDTKLVIVAISGASTVDLDTAEGVQIMDISNYDTVMKLKEVMNFVEGQNLIAASDLVICKCGYGFISECLSVGIKFRYVVETRHREANAIHSFLKFRGLANSIQIEELRGTDIDLEFIHNSPSLKMDLDNGGVANHLLACSSIKS